MKILVVGRGVIGKALAAYDTDYHLGSSEDYLAGKFLISDWAGVVNAAGVVGEGSCRRHSWYHVVKANVELPLKIKKACEYFNVPNIQLSTVGIYQRQTSLVPDKFDDEDAPVFPYNAYTASKLLMEQLISRGGIGTSTIFRLAFFEDHEQWYHRVLNWKEVQNTYTNFTTVAVLSKAIKNVLGRAHTLNGVYNIAADVQYLPHFIDQLRQKMSYKLHQIPKMRIREEHPHDMTSVAPISTEKAMRKGVL